MAGYLNVKDDEDLLREENARLRALLEASVKADHYPDRDPKERFALCVPCTERRNAIGGVLWPCDSYRDGMAALRGGGE